MTDGADTFRAARVRPVAELPIEALLPRARELTRRWAVALVLASPLDRLGTIPLEDLAREGPALLTLVLQAVGSDAALDRLLACEAPVGLEQASPACRLRLIAGAGDSAGAVAAVEALRGVLGEALFDQLLQPSALQAADASDRLAYVCSKVLGAMLGGGDAAAGQPSRAAVGGRRSHPGDADGPAARASAVIVDEHADAEILAGPTSPRGDAVRASAPAAAAPPGAPPDPAVVVARHPEIEIRDERGEGGPAAWIGSIGRALDRFKQDGLPFAVLLVELSDLEQLSRSATAAELRGLADRVEDALEAELRRFAPGSVARRDRRYPERAPAPGSLTRESPGRYWLLAPRTNRLGARGLAERLAQAVASSSSGRGAPLEVAIGTAVCPEDGRDAPALAAHADVGVYAARSSRARRGSRVDEPA